ncbi:alkaline phosphatase [Bacteroidia bacterium]|nr:alkaline phosphatase [Bacteroidia bacterium]
MNRVITSLIAFLAVAGVRAQQQVDVPKLVVTITIDQLRGDYLQYFSPTFGERGFKRLLNEGLVYHQMQYGFPNLSQASSIATLYTGTYPYYHNIPGNKKYDFESKRELSIIYDSEYIGNFTSENFSPLSLTASTIGDELKMASNGKSDVFSIAPDALAAVLSAGRQANAAFWLDDYNGKWATTTYYKGIPWYIDRYNTSEATINKSDAQWVPALRSYNAFPYTKNTTPFKYDFIKGDKNKYLKIKQTPLINSEITSLASKFFEYADFGKRIHPDLISITYYAGNYKENGNDEYSWEIQDTYHRLDKEIERLLDLIEQKAGLKNTLVVLTSTGYFESKTDRLSGFKPTGEFFPSRCTALLNMYLMALYGQANWVQGYYNNQIYLNKKYIDDLKMDWVTILKQSADFVSQFSGIQDVATSSEMIFEEQAAGRNTFRRGMSKKLSGHIFIELQPGWVVVNENNPETKIINSNAIITPLIFLGNNIPHQHIYRPVKAVEVAPTISYVLRIRPPNGCREIPLPEFLH